MPVHAPVTIGLVTCVWRRPAMLRAFLRHWQCLGVPDVDWIRIAAISPEDTSTAPDIARRARGFETVEFPNTHLSCKFNAAFRALRGRVDAALVVGSDDFADRAYIEACAEAYREGAHVVIPDGLYVADAETRRAIYLRGRRIGIGRLLSAEVLGKMGYEPYPPRERYVNGNMDTRLARLQAEAKQRSKRFKREAGVVDGAFDPVIIPSRESGVLLDVKSAGSKNPYRDLEGNPRAEAVNFEDVVGHFPALEGLLKMPGPALLANKREKP